MAAYGEFARVYDTLMAEGRDAGEWPAYLLGLLRAHGITPPGKVLDVGCGTGHVALALLEAGYRVTGLDNSAAMLGQAARNAHEKGVFLPLMQEDMRCLSSPDRVHAITCACDPVNYLPDARDVGQFFQSAFQALYPGGVLLFDVCTPHYYNRVLEEACHASVQPQAVHILQVRPEGKQCRMTLTMFIQQRNGAYHRSDEEHVLTAYEKQTLLGLLQQNGFTSCKAYRFGSTAEAGDADERWQFSAIKVATAPEQS